MLDDRCARRPTVSAAVMRACSAAAQPRDDAEVMLQPADRQDFAGGVIRRVCVGVAALALVLALAAATGGGIGGLVTPAAAQPAATAGEQAAARAAYDQALRDFKAVLAERRGQIERGERLPERPGQALYLARVQLMSTYKDLTDAVPSRIGRANTFAIPPAYFDAANAPLLDEYVALFNIMQAPPAGAQASSTPFKDVADLGRAIARARGLDAASVDAAGRISLGIFFAETNGNQNITNVRSAKYMGSFQTGVEEDRKGREAWAALLPKVAALDPAVAARDAAETARVGAGDQRFNHWTAVRNGLMHAHAGLLAELPAIMAMLPDPIDQMKLFQLIQIVPSPTRAALKSGNVGAWRISEPRIMGYLRNNSILAFGSADRARESASYREILDAMWLFTDKFERARAAFAEVKAGERRRLP
jgi:hypothetical protein